jgi:hypothetical protein
LALSSRIETLAALLPLLLLLLYRKVFPLCRTADIAVAPAVGAGDGGRRIVDVGEFVRCRGPDGGAGAARGELRG